LPGRPVACTVAAEPTPSPLGPTEKNLDERSLPMTAILRHVPSSRAGRTMGTLRHRASLVAGAWLLALSVHAGTWAPNATLVPTPADVLDPEFSQSLGMIVWGDAVGRLWIANVDRATGDFVPADGRGTLVDPYAQTYNDATKTYNGPEWVSTANGDQIVYTK